MSTRLIQVNGAQVLPEVGDQRATVTGWVAFSAADADQRRRSSAYAEVAANLIIVDADTTLCGVRFYESDAERCTKLAGHVLEIHGNRRYAWGPGLVVPETTPTPSGGLLDLLEEATA